MIGIFLFCSVLLLVNTIPHRYVPFLYSHLLRTKYFVIMECEDTEYFASEFHTLIVDLSLEIDDSGIYVRSISYQYVYLHDFFMYGHRSVIVEVELGHELLAFMNFYPNFENLVKDGIWIEKQVGSSIDGGFDNDFIKEMNGYNDIFVGTFIFGDNNFDNGAPVPGYFLNNEVFIELKIKNVYVKNYEGSTQINFLRSEVFLNDTIGYSGDYTEDYNIKKFCSWA